MRRRQPLHLALWALVVAGLVGMQADAATVSTQTMTGNSYPASSSSMFPSSSGSRVAKLHYTPTYVLNPFFGPASGNTHVRTLHPPPQPNTCIAQHPSNTQVAWGSPSYLTADPEWAR
jgi:hypothetical protein